MNFVDSSGRGPAAIRPNPNFVPLALFGGETPAERARRNIHYHFRTRVLESEKAGANQFELPFDFSYDPFHNLSHWELLRGSVEFEKSVALGKKHLAEEEAKKAAEKQKQETEASGSPAGCSATEPTPAQGAVGQCKVEYKSPSTAEAAALLAINAPTSFDPCANGACVMAASTSLGELTDREKEHLEQNERGKQAGELIHALGLFFEALEKIAGLQEQGGIEYETSGKPVVTEPIRPWAVP